MIYQEFLEAKRITQEAAGFHDARSIQLNPKLFDWQRDLVHWALRIGRADHWCDCGLGKTFMQLEWARAVYERTNKNVLILAPLAVAGQTRREGLKFDIEVTVCKSQQDVRRGLNVANYERLDKFDPDQFGAIVCDESSILKAYDGSTRKQITDFATRIPYRLGASATPAPNDFMELGTQSEFVGSLTRAEMLAMFFVHDGGETSKWRLKNVVTSQAEGAVVKNIERKERDAERMAERISEHMKDLMVAEVVGVREGGVAAESETAKGEGWRAVLGDCVSAMQLEPADSIDYSIFSPPFASLYTYSDALADMGNCKDHSEFYEHFKFCVAELYRVLKPGRNLSFHCMNLPASKERDGFIGIKDFRGELIRLFQHAGFIYHSEVCIWKDPVTAMQRTKAIGLLYKQLRKDSTISRQGIPDYLVTMRKPGVNPDPVTKVARPVGTTFKHPRNVPSNEMDVSEWQEYASPVWNMTDYPDPVWMDINPSDTLQRESAREEDDERHICPLQLEVIRRAIRLWSNPDDLVLSPFMGIGSEGYVARQMNRRFLGVELKRSYWQQAAANLKAVARQDSLFSDLMGTAMRDADAAAEQHLIETEGAQPARHDLERAGNVSATEKVG